MKMISQYIIVSILSLYFTCSFGVEETRVLPNRTQIMKLAAAAWKEPIQSIDATYYVTVRKTPRTVDEIEASFLKSLSQIYGNASQVPDDVVEMNVSRALEEQKEGMKRKERLRSKGYKEKKDVVYAIPDYTMFPGTDLQRKVSGKKLEHDTPYDSTRIRKIENNILTEIGINLQEKTALIQNQSLDSSNGFTLSSVFNMAMMPKEVIQVLQVAMGNKNSLVDETYLPDEDKIERILLGDTNDLSIKLQNDTKSDQSRDKIAIDLLNEDLAGLSMVIVCDKQDYSKVFEFECRFQPSNQLLIKRVCNDFDANGFPHYFQIAEYTYDGNLKAEITYKFEEVYLNTPIEDDVFEFNPPDNYRITDMRLPIDERTQQEILLMKKWLNHAEAGNRIEAFSTLSNLLKDSPDELKEIAIMMLDDDNATIRERALRKLQIMLQDDPGQLRNIALLVKNDANPRIRLIAKQLLETNKEESGKPGTD